MELTEQGITNMISRSENTVKEMFSTLNASYIQALELCAYYIDVGFTNCYSTSWAMLLHFPAPAMPVMEMSEMVCTEESLHISPVETDKLPEQTKPHWNRKTLLKVHGLLSTISFGI